MIIDGKKLAEEKLKVLGLKVQEFKRLNGRAPSLAIVTTGDDLATQAYIRNKITRAQEIGIETEIVPTVTDAKDADGIIVQLPFPNADEEIAKIPLEKDVDGLKPGSKFLPATVKAILEMIAVSGKQLEVSTTCVVGQGRPVGKPLAEFLSSKSYQVIKCDINTLDLKSETLKGDILVVATGVPGLIKADMVKPGAVVIDCGAPKAEVDFENVKNVASAITPIPGGVGPMTVACLLENLLKAARINHSLYEV